MHISALNKKEIDIVLNLREMPELEWVFVFMCT